MNITEIPDPHKSYHLDNSLESWYFLEIKENA